MPLLHTHREVGVGGGECRRHGAGDVIDLAVDLAALVAAQHADGGRAVLRHQDATGLGLGHAVVQEGKARAGGSGGGEPDRSPACR